MIKQSLEGLTEQSTSMTTSKSAGRKSSMVLRTGHVTIGYRFWQKDEELREGFNIVRIQTLPINSCTFMPFKDIQEMLLIQRCKTLRREREWIEFNKQKWIDFSRKTIKRGRQSVFFTTVNSMVDGNGTGEIPRDLTKPRIAPYKNTWKRLQNTVFWCNLKLSQERVAILPNTVTCRESGM